MDPLQVRKFTAFFKKIQITFEKDDVPLDYNVEVSATLTLALDPNHHHDDAEQSCLAHALVASLWRYGRFGWYRDQAQW
jgi:hypothetical protein